MNGADERILDQAIAWHLASTREDMDWDGFTRWLEASPRHRAALDEIALADAALDDHRDTFAPLTDVTELRAFPRWPLWTGGALAASLAALLLVPLAMTPPAQTFATQDRSQQIVMADGGSVVLAPHSRLTISGRQRDQLALEGGALFTIRHDPARKLSIAAGGLEIGDIGTRFDVQTNGSAVRVEVSEGRVELRGEALSSTVDLLAGHRMLFDPAHGLATVAPVSPREVGEWREGRLTYDGAPLPLVAADLSRYAGVSVTVPPPLAGRRFSGTLSIHDGDSAVRDLAQLMGLQLSGHSGAYRLAAGS